MKRNVKKTVLLIVLIIVLALVIEAVVIFMVNLAKRDNENSVEQVQTRIEANTDVRRFNSDRLKDKEDISQNDYSKQEDFADVLPLVRYNTFTVWPDKSKMPDGKKADPAAQLERAKNVGLGYEKLHLKGITGKGVNIGIIDQNIYTDHPEYSHAFKEYKVFGDTQVEGSAMSTALISLVAGKTTGVAPDVGIYYAAVAIEEQDVQYFRDAMLWYEELNKTLAEADKIRVVMLPTNLHGSEAMFETNAEMWDEMVEIAERSGITILDCADGRRFGACWRDVYKPNDFSKVKPGYPQDSNKESSSDLVLFPISQKTVAEEYDEGEHGYQYVPNSGATWALAEYVGTLALGQQVINEQVAGEQTTGEQVAGEQTTGEQVAGEQTTGEQVAGEQATGAQTAGDQTTGAPEQQQSVEWLTDKMYETAYVLKQGKGKGENAAEYRIIDVEKFCAKCSATSDADK